ncbi:MAG: hypothetical protein PHX61_08045 [Alphaproteobacteria bacterium]|nr:hypothetical protein [Alphaproteobacteria bacterium]
MFGKKKLDLPAGVRLWHYEGVPQFPTNGPAFLNVEGADLLIRTVQPDSVAKLPTDRITGLDWLQETHYMGRFHNCPSSTAKANAEKWIVMINYATKEGSPAHMAFWTLRRKDYDDVEGMLKGVNALGSKEISL